MKMKLPRTVVLTGARERCLFPFLKAQNFIFDKVRELEIIKCTEGELATIIRLMPNLKTMLSPDFAYDTWTLKDLRACNDELSERQRDLEQLSVYLKLHNGKTYTSILDLQLTKRI